MGIATALERRSLENPSTSLANPAAWLWDALGSSKGATGVSITENNAMRIAAVYACVRVLSETLAVLPLPVYRRTGTGAEKATDHPYYTLLHDRPNPELSSFNFREMMQAHMALWGNAWAEKELGKDGRVKAFWPLLPDRTRAMRVNGRKVVVTRLPDGRDQVLPGERVLHIPGLGFDGLQGMSVIRTNMDALGLSKAAEEYGARFFGQGATVAGVLSHPGTLTEPAQQRIRGSFENMYAGLSNSHRVAILEEGMKYEKIGIPPEEAQFIELRKYQRSEVAAIYRVPPHMIGDLDRPFQSNVEQMDLDFVRHTMTPWLVRWEQVLNWELFTEAERKEFYAEFLVEGLLRGDSAARATFYREMWMIGALSQNDILRRENMNTVDDGDERWVPLNMLPMSIAVRGPEPRPVPEPAPTRALPPAEDRAAKQARAQRSVMARKRIERSHEALFRDAAARIIRREVAAGRAAVKKGTSPDPKIMAAAIRKWMEEFYPEHAEYIVRQMMPAIQAMGSAIWTAAADEVNGSGDLTPDAEKFLRSYAESLASRHISSSQGQIDALLGADVASGDELGAVLNERMGEWEEKWPDKAATNETVRLGAAMSKAAWVAAGVSVMRWVANANSCGICQDMDGLVVGIDEDFVSRGETVDGEEGQNPLTARQSFSHPPLHGGCTCGIAPG